MKQKTYIYTDGSSSKNGFINTISSYAFVVVQDNNKIFEYQSPKSNHTNNQMELLAIINAFDYALENAINHFTIFSDSQYALNTLFKWYPKWKKLNQLNNKANIDLLKKHWEPVLLKILSTPHLKYSTKWIKSHSSQQDEHSIWNNYVDNLASFDYVVPLTLDKLIDNLFD